MMGDLVNRLRSKTIMVNTSDVSQALFEAADRIEELEGMLRTVLDDSLCVRGVLYDMDKRLKQALDKEQPIRDLEEVIDG